ncbi:MAG TPA: hypothetical protein PKE03_09980 [Bacteroidales bacterium]|nr:hypothetical protein [Bacteroidales bacterium]
MKKTITTLLFSAMAGVVLAGGIVTNTNQSASFLRNPARGGLLGIESAYYNPAGMTKLNDGFHLSLSNQFIFQDRKIKTSLAGLNRNEFSGEVTVPLFPSVYAVFKKNKFAVSLGFNPIGGGGEAFYPNGLPSFEYQIAGLKSSLNASGIPTTQYSYATEFEGESVYLGYQANAAYQFNKMFSASVGVRYVTIDNSYKGYLKDISINPNFPAAGFTGTMVKAPVFFEAMAGLFTNLAGVGTSIAPLAANAQTQNLTLPQLVGAGLLTQEQAASIAGGFGLINPNVNANTLPISAIHQGYVAATPTFTANANAMNASKAATSDKKVDAIQTGSGIIPVVGLNFNFEKVNIGFKYEHRAAIKVKNETTQDDVGMFPDGAEVPSDIPSMISVGIGYEPSKRVGLAANYITYLDKSAEYGKMLNGQYVKNDKLMDRNVWEFAFGMHYKTTEKLYLSAGYLVTSTSVKPEYQSDLSHSLSTFTLAGGAKYAITEKIAVNAGVMRTYYNTYVKNFAPQNQPQFGETYSRKNLSFGLGLDLSF